MGSFLSKSTAARAASRRQYPKTPSPSTTTTRQPAASQSPGPKYHPQEQASATRSEAIDLDARDPDFAASLRKIGPVTPNPTLSNSSTFKSPSVFPDANNPTLLVLSSRARIASAAEKEAEVLGRPDHEGREFIDVVTIRQLLQMRNRQNLPDEQIERLLRLKKGVVSRLGPKGLVAEVAP